MASQSAADLQQVQAQMIQSLDQIQSLSIEIAAMNTKMDFLNSDRIEKATQIQHLISTNQLLSAEIRRSAASSSMSRGSTDVKLIDMKTMGPKKFDGKIDSPYRAWAKGGAHLLQRVQARVPQVPPVD